MANRNAKLIERTLKDFSLGAMSGDGGTKVVTELPKVGEANTIYELQEDKPDDYPWCLTEIDTTAKYPTPFGCMIVVETLEDAQAMGNPEYRDVVFWIRSESKAYQCFVDKGGGWVEFDEVVPVHNVYNSQLGVFVVLRDFDYHFTGNDKDYYLDGTGHFLDDSVFNYPTDSQTIIPLILTNGLDKKWALNNNVVAFSTCQNITSESELPTAKQAVDNNMCNIDGFVTYPIPIILSQNIGYNNMTDTETYHWGISTRQFIEKSTGEQYTGTLEWEVGPIAQINKIDLSLDFGRVDLYMFAPQSAHIEITYWIYSNDTWVNIDEIGKPSGFTISLVSKGNARDGIDGFSFDNFEIAVNDKSVQLEEYYTGVGSETHSDIYGCVSGVEVPDDGRTLYTAKIILKDPSIIETFSIMGFAVQWEGNLVGSLNQATPSLVFELGNFEKTIVGELILTVQVQK